MQTIFLTNLEQAFKLTADLALVLKEENLREKLPNLKSNKIGEQFWCIIGARESFLKAIILSEWQGFSCSVKNSFSVNEIQDKLLQTGVVFTNEILHLALNQVQTKLLLDLYTHEIQHHGQLIRYCYALGIDFPKSWNMKYTV